MLPSRLLGGVRGGAPVFCCFCVQHQLVLFEHRQLLKDRLDLGILDGAQAPDMLLHIGLGSLVAALAAFGHSGVVVTTPAFGAIPRGDVRLLLGLVVLLLLWRRANGAAELVDKLALGQLLK